MPMTQAERPIVISDDDARGGVTGHNVRYVLAFGLTGVVAAFAAIVLYFGYDQMQARIAEALAVSPLEVLREAAPYGGIVLAGALIGGLLLGLVTLIGGRADNASQFGMRVRIVAQFALICVIMAMLYVSTGA